MATVIEPQTTDDNKPTEPRETLAGYVAEFSDPESLLQAAEKTRDAGFKSFDCYVPFPLHGLDDAMGIKPTRLPFIVLGCAAVGLTIAFILQWYSNATEFSELVMPGYEYIISGKPLLSIPSSMPVNFELTVLCSAFGALLGMLVLNDLPKFYNRLFLLDPFQKVTTNGFFLGIESTDPKFHVEDTKAFLKDCQPTEVIDCIEPVADYSLPKILAPVALTLAIIGLIPLVIVARMRAMPSDVPRIELVQDMDFQPKLKTQKMSAMFADSRGMRPVIAGTFARGDLQQDSAFFQGLLSDQADDVDPAMLLPNAKNPDGTSVKLDDMPWVTELPITADEELMLRGKERYNIYCSVCHGMTGKGDGLVTLRAMELQKGSPDIGTWVNPIPLYSEAINKQPVGQLFNTITHGVRKMPGYASQIPVEDRWAIVLYLRALQKAGSGTIESVPEDLRETLAGGAVALEQ